MRTSAAALIGFGFGVAAGLAAFIPGLRNLEPYQREWIAIRRKRTGP